MHSVIFLGSKPVGYRCLQLLIGAQEALGLRVAGVLTRARSEFSGESDLAQLAAQHGIPLIATPDEMPECDILYSVQYHRILRAAHIAKARRIALNLHMAPLPEYRGSNQFSFAIIDGAATFGATIHAIDEGIDSGDILFEKRFPLPPGCWVDELYTLTLEASVALFEETLPQVAAGTFSRTPQASLAAARGSSLHYKKDIGTLKQIDLSWPEERILRHIRATSMPGFEPPYTVIGGHKISLSR